jgi:salicylate biosynthesis isochorismate synthase
MMGRVEAEPLDGLGSAEIISMASRSDDLQVYWRSDGFTCAGFGIAATRWTDKGEAVDDLLCALQEDAAQLDPHGRIPGPWFGGLGFDTQIASEPLWSGFPASRWVLPRTLYWATKQGCWRVSFPQAMPPETAGSDFQGMPPGATTPPESAYDVDAFHTKVNEAVDAIASGSLDKIVVSMGVDVPLGPTFSPMKALGRQTPVPGVAQFLLRGADDSWLVGASPETLLKIRGNQLLSDALGGSVALGGAYSDKEWQEHQFVVDAIVQALQPLTNSVALSPTRTWDLPYISHLHTEVRATRKPDSPLWLLVSALHPTPAVCGWPTSVTRGLLRSSEASHRGWYTGLVGSLGAARADLLVCLRCALVRPQQARIFVGAGVVKGSCAESEVAEAKAKTAAMRSVLCAENRPTP